MSKPVVVGFHPRKGDHAPVRFGAVIGRVTGAPVAVVSVHHPTDDVVAAGVTPAPPVVIAGAEDVGRDGGCRAAIDNLEPEIRAWQLRVECLNLRGDSAARALHWEAERQDAGLLVVGTSQRESRRLGGSTAERLLHGAPCPLAVVPRSWSTDGALHVVGVGYAAGPEGDEALRGAAALAGLAGATLRVVTAVRGGDDDARGVEEAVRGAAASLAGDVPVQVEVVAGDAADALVRASEELDVLVCGSRGYGPLRAVLLGSVSRRVTAAASCPVVVLPRGLTGSLEALFARASSSARA